MGRDVSDSAKKKPMAPVVSTARPQLKEETFLILESPAEAVKPIRGPGAPARQDLSLKARAGGKVPRSW
jgi:hypothetical protein